MNGKQLKNSILQWAIQGKLVPQDPNDEPASVLLEQIRAEKARLVKEKKIKKDKNESIIFRGVDNSHYEKFSDGRVVCIDDEIPFDIPESWEWCRLSSVTIYLHRGKSPKYGEAKLLPIIAQKCNQWDKIYTDRCLFSDQESISKYNEEHYLKIGDVIINSTGGGTVGRTGYVDDYVFFLYKNFVADSHVTVVRCSNKMNSKYLYYYLLSPYIQIGLEDKCSGSTNQIELGTNTIANYLLPVPPLDEQIRIVEKIATSSPLVENYALSQEKLEELNKRLFINLKKSILQEAIQGRLVPQIAEEGDASELLQQIEEEKQKLVKEGKLKKKDLVSSTIYRGDDNR
ncbi:MAG: restriction endonuclease subunit S, partial [Paludibacteraceae bacterium]|nr:restriction endonuclease subunit S [Paludibacteraceae bacterium]